MCKFYTWLCLKFTHGLHLSTVLFLLYYYKKFIMKGRKSKPQKIKRINTNSNNMQKAVFIAKGFIMTIGTIAIVYMITFVLGQAFEKQAKVDCLKWQDYATVYPEYDEESKTGFYLTQWQDEQCKALKVNIQAKVIKQYELK